MAGRLYVVATPIGNLGDLSARACEILKTCALIAAEDTRHTGVLLKHFNIETPQVSLHDHNEGERIPDLLSRLRQGASIALVSDAGTPAISDPGFELVRAAAAAGIDVIAVPGPCAAIAALSIGGLPTDRFCFEGFLPARGAARRKRLELLIHEPRTVVLYESPHRVRDMLEDCVEAFGGERSATLAREITKMHETTYRGTLREILARAVSDPDVGRGEIVLVLGAAKPAADEGERGADGHGGALDRVLNVLLAELPLKQAARLAAQLSEVRDNEAYKRALQLKEG
jgi:16S rRNA (cytidine1402-2'-O)-methyltransferase